MSERRSGRYSMLQKIKVECKTCEISESFYSKLSVEQFKVRHAGHQVVEASDGAQAAPARRLQGATEDKSLEEETARKVSKVIVSMEASPSLGQPLVRIRGFGEDLEEAFSATVPYNEAEKAREILAKGEFVDYDVTGRRYTWEVGSVEYELDAQEMLAAPTQELAEEIAPETEAQVSEVPPAPEDLAAATPEPPTVVPAEEAEKAVAEELLSSLVSAPDTMEEIIEAPAPLAAVEQARQPQPEPMHVEAPMPPASAPAKARMKETPVPHAEQKDDGYLLVSKSWYIQGGTGNRDEAVRVSKVLKEFRWRVEPIYTIGVILDDMLCIETSRNQISRTLISRVEGAGYRLTAVTIEQGKPVAWFRKHAGTGADESELDLESDLTA